MNQISAVIITLNEEAKIGQALDSLRDVADEIVVVDSGSQDRTEEICRHHTERFMYQEWNGYRRQKQFATDQARHDWVLSVDADEMLSMPLRVELMKWKNKSPEHSGYFLPRKTFFLGRWIRHTTWYPDWQLRLFRKSKARWVGGRVHESVVVDGNTARLPGDLEHYTYSSISEYLEQLESFSALAAADYYDAGRRTGPLKLVFLPFAAFLKNYIVRRGFLDGTPGLAVSCLSATSVFFKHLKLWEKQKTFQPVRGFPET